MQINNDPTRMKISVLKFSLSNSQKRKKKHIPSNFVLLIQIILFIIQEPETHPNSAQSTDIIKRRRKEEISEGTLEYENGLRRFIND